MTSGALPQHGLQLTFARDTRREGGKMLRIISNYHSREIIYGWELSEGEREEFDWMTDDELDAESFFRYKDTVYALSEFMRIEKNAPKEFQGWAGYLSDSFFSGILVRYPSDSWDTDHIVVGWYLS